MADIMNSRLQVPPELEGAGAMMNRTAATIEGQLITLRGQLVPLEDSWQGPAQDSWHGLQAQWNYAADGLFGPNGVLGAIASALNLSWDNYCDCEWANVRTWRG
jgi:WXG100 family type VII secretion target